MKRLVSAIDEMIKILPTTAEVRTRATQIENGIANPSGSDLSRVSKRTARALGLRAKPGRIARSIQIPIGASSMGTDRN